MKSKSWKLWLDDQSDDVECPARHAPEGFTAAKSCIEAMDLVDAHGPPQFMDLDHDLGDGRDTIFFLRWLSNQVVTPPEYNVHSANPVGRANIKSFMESWLRSINS